MTNRLADETSPYLQQHKKNPVDWYPWGEEAFNKAKDEDKPLFISIGYSTCHWCHVMARESFEDKKTAEFMNDNFVNIKVDREERPDIDKLYQRYYNSLTGESGGWPLSVWAFPDGLPFFIGTYFPNSFNLRHRTFMSICKEITDSWENERDELMEISTGLSRNVDSSNKIMFKQKKSITPKIFSNEISKVTKRFDYANGGIDKDPKFPRFSLLRFLLQQGYKTNNQNLINFVQFTFHQMGKGGIYDQLGGGISRYSVDSKWLVPHFEKMLYDNAGFLKLGSELYSITKDDFVKYLIEDTISFLTREMQSEHGVFYSSIDAESEGKEGKFYVWHHDEIKSVLDKSYRGIHLNLIKFRLSIDKPVFLLNDDVKIAKKRYGFSRWGNFNDPHGDIVNANVLNIDSSIGEIANSMGLDRNYVVDRLNEIKYKLFEKRESRTKPDVDKKMITAWNAMLASSLFSVAEKIESQDAGEMGRQILDYLITHCIKDDHVIRSIYKSHKIEQNYIEGILDDYSFFIEALIEAFEYTNDFEYIDYAEKLLKIADTKFYSSDGVYYLNQDESVDRIMVAMDDSFSSSLAIMVKNLYKLGNYLENQELIDRGRDILMRLADPLEEYEASMNEMLISADYYLSKPIEIVVVNDVNKKFDKTILKQYIPSRLIFRWQENNSMSNPHWAVVENRTNTDQPTVYICRGNTCSLPIVEEHKLKEEIKK